VAVGFDGGSGIVYQDCSWYFARDQMSFYFWV